MDIYPPNWSTEIRPRILDRANNCCELCGLKNHAVGYRDRQGAFIGVENISIIKKGKLFIRSHQKMIKISLSVSHKDHDANNWEVEDTRLQAVCQKCHLNYDAKYHSHKKAARKAVGTLSLF